MADKYFQLFQLDFNTSDTVFEWLILKPFQKKVLMVRDERVQIKCSQFMSECDELLHLIPKKKDIKHPTLQKVFAVVAQQLRQKLVNKKSNGLRGVLREHLYEIQPETTDQLHILPRLKIGLGVDVVHQFHFEIK